MACRFAIAKPLVGIARQAAAGDLLQQKRQAEYRSLPTKSWLNRCHSTRVPFDWTINPYRGCEFACQYCYARYTHTYLERLEPESFETEIFAKSWNADCFRRELRQVRPGQTIAIGTATDPYQPAECRFCLTHSVLECLTMLHGIRLCLTTKSDLVSRDSGLLAQISRNNRVYVAMTITTTDLELARLTEPRAPHPNLRFSAVHALRVKGLLAGVTASPILPYVTDSRVNLASIAHSAKEADATPFGGGVLFLRDVTRATYLKFLSRCFPELVPWYEASFRQSSSPQPAYLDRMKSLIDEVRGEAGIQKSDLQFPKSVAPVNAVNPQLQLFDEVVTV